MASVNLYAQPRPTRGGVPRGGHREMVVNRHGNAPMHGRNAVHVAQPHRMHAAPMHHHLDAHGYLPGWHGRVRYLDGRWGYYRDSRWYWYDTYFAPDYYYAHPVAHFRTHFYGHNVAAAVGGVAAGIAVSALISALAR